MPIWRGVARATITGLIDTLERDGLATREHVSGDRRMMQIRMTEKGLAVLRDIIPGHFKQMAGQMASLNEHERKTLVRLLTKLAAHPPAAHVEAVSHSGLVRRTVLFRFPYPILIQPMKTFLSILAVVAVIAIIIAVKVSQITTLIHTKVPLQVESVSTADVKSETWQETLTSVGSLTAVQGVTVAAELDGKIAAVNFTAGASVNAGDVLVRQDTSAEEAQLRSAEASAELATVNLRRTKELLEKETVSQSQFDADSATGKQAEAAADNIRATIAKKTIKAPFSGKLGIRLVNLGQNLKAGDSIVSLQALDPIFVDFYMPQENLGRLATGLTVALSGDAIAGKAVEGKVTAISPDVDASTRNVRVQATVANAAGHLHPGMYVDVAVELPVTNKVLTIPATAVLYAPFGDTVYVVDTKSDPDTHEKTQVVRQQIVRLGARRGDFVAVLSGINAGDRVVTSGVFRLRPGSAVTVNNSYAPDAQLAPKPSDS